MYGIDIKRIYCKDYKGDMAKTMTNARLPR